MNHVAGPSASTLTNNDEVYIYSQLQLEQGNVRVSKYPRIKLNSKVVIFDNHLTLIYFTCGKTI